jgi:hypothetical protein
MSECVGFIHLHESSVIWDIMPCSPFKVNRRFGWTCRPHLQAQRISEQRLQALLVTYYHAFFCVAFSFTLKMEAKCSSETLVYSQGTAPPFNPFITAPVRTSDPELQQLRYLSLRENYTDRATATCRRS